MEESRTQGWRENDKKIKDDLVTKLTFPRCYVFQEPLLLVTVVEVTYFLILVRSARPLRKPPLYNLSIPRLDSLPRHIYRYVSNALTPASKKLRDVEEDLKRQGKTLRSKCPTPFTSNYAPWTEVTPELKADSVQRFQELIGQLLWAVEIGRVDILVEVS